MKERAKARAKEEAENGGEIQIAKESPIVQIILIFKAAHEWVWVRSLVLKQMTKIQT